MQPLEHGRIIQEGRQRRPALAMRTLLWAILVVCAALLVATVSEAWTRANVEEQVQTASARNAALRHDVAATQRAITLARSPEEIERVARRWGYIRPGDRPILVVIAVPAT